MSFYFSSAEAKNLFDCATELGLTSKEYMWIISSSSIGNIVSKARRAAPSYPLGLLGMSFVENQYKFTVKQCILSNRILSES